MAKQIVQLQGGPDAGVELVYNVPPALPATITYSGSVYSNAHKTKVDSAGNTVHLFAYSGDASPGNAKLPAGHDGYNKFQHAYARTLPTKLARSKATRRAALRKLKAPRKIQNL